MVTSATELLERSLHLAGRSGTGYSCLLTLLGSQRSLGAAGKEAAKARLHLVAVSAAGLDSRRIRSSAC